MKYTRLITLFVLLGLLFSIAPVTAGAVPTITTPFRDYTLGAGETKPWVVPVSNPLLPEKMDIIYVVDTTGSMSGRRTTIANTLNQFSADLAAAGAADVQFGTAFYGDKDSDTPWYGLALDLGDHTIPEVQAAISSLHTTWGGIDAEEDSLMAYMETVAQASWREGSTRIIVLITDATTKLRPTETVGGFPVSLAGATAMRAAYGVDVALMINGSTSQLAGMATALDATEYYWINQATLTTALNTAIIPTTGQVPDCVFEAKIESITYQSDGTASTDVSASVSPASILLSVNATGTFDLTATAVATPARYNDTTVVEVGFYRDGARLASATQFVYFGVEKTIKTLAPTSDPTSLSGLFALLALGALAVAVSQRKMRWTD